MREKTNKIRKRKKDKMESKKGKKLTKETIGLIGIVAIIILVDQALKIWVQIAGEITIIPEFLKFQVNQNTGSAYGIGSNSTLMYVATHIVILGVIFKFIATQNEFVDRKLKVFLSLILAGGISNVLERVVRGYVTQFIKFQQIPTFPIFNIADLFVLMGWIAVAGIFASFTVKEWRKKK